MKEECLICKAPLEYLERAEMMECELCHKKELSNTRCINGHYVCNECHTEGMDAIIGLCLEETSKDPIAIIRKMMDMEFCHMHGPEHHVMVGAALLTAYKNAGGQITRVVEDDDESEEQVTNQVNDEGDEQIADQASDHAEVQVSDEVDNQAENQSNDSLTLHEALVEMLERGRTVPGGACGFWGACGAGVSTGIFISIISGSTPLTNESFGLSHKMTSRSLAAIGEIGGPRCCKRDSYISILQAIDFVKENFGVEMEKPEIVCIHSSQNNQCIGRRCPFCRKKS